MECIEAVIERQERVAAEGDDHGLLLKRECRRVWFGWTPWSIRD